MIDASLNEVESVAAKAARGAGLPWGICEDTGKAARWLAAQGLPWAASLIDLLGELNDFSRPEGSNGSLGPADNSGALSPLLCGPFIADTGLSDTALSIERVAWPMWLLPFVARIVRASGRSSMVIWGNASVRLEPDGFFADETSDLTTGRAMTITISIAPEGERSAPPRSPATRSRISMTNWRKLDEIGARTYVPGSVHSRAKGAGAGLVDND